MEFVWVFFFRWKGVVIRLCLFYGGEFKVWRFFKCGLFISSVDDGFRNIMVVVKLIVVIVRKNFF